MNVWDEIAEQKIREAMEAGVFEDLPGLGKPLPDRDDAHVPPELRMAFSVLKNAGVLPEGLQLAKERVDLRAILAACDDEDLARSHRARLQEVETRIAMLAERNRGSVAFRRYAGRIRGKLAP